MTSRSPYAYAIIYAVIFDIVHAIKCF